MTLREWEKKFGGSVVRHDDRVAVMLPKTHSASEALYHTTDYAVSSVSGGVCWMVPKIVKCTHPDHVDGTSCEDRAVGCHKQCKCCIGK